MLLLRQQRPRRRVIPALGLAAALVASMLTTILAATPAAAVASTDCSKGGIVVIGLRGSGEPKGGMGAAVDNFVRQLNSKLPNVPVVNSPLDAPNYNAPAIMPTNPIEISLLTSAVKKVPFTLDALAWWVGKYLIPVTISINDTEPRLQQQIDRISTACPDSKIVVAGYSQGAMIIHRLYEMHPATAAKVFASVLIADGDRNSKQGQSGQTALNFGNAPVNAVGIRYLVNGGSTELKTGRIVDVCAKNDMVCNPISLNPSIGIHLSYADNTAKGNGIYVEQAGTQVANWYKNNQGTFTISGTKISGAYFDVTSKTPCPAGSTNVVILTNGETPNNDGPRITKVNADGSWSFRYRSSPWGVIAASGNTATVTTPAKSLLIGAVCITGPNGNEPVTMTYTKQTVTTTAGLKYTIAFNSKTATSVTYTITPDKCAGNTPIPYFGTDTSTNYGVAITPNLFPSNNGKWGPITVTRTYWSPRTYMNVSGACYSTSHDESTRVDYPTMVTGWQIP